MIEETTLHGPESLELQRVEAFARTPAFDAAFAEALGAEPPSAGRWVQAGAVRIYFAEEKAWYVEGAPDDLAERLKGLAGVSDISGAFRRLKLQGPAAAEALSLETFFPTADRNLGEGDLVATLLRHAPVLMAFAAPDQIDLFVPPSYAKDMTDGLGAALKRRTAA